VFNKLPFIVVFICASVLNGQPPPPPTGQGIAQVTVSPSGSCGAPQNMQLNYLTGQLYTCSGSPATWQLVSGAGVSAVTATLPATSSGGTTPNIAVFPFAALNGSIVAVGREYNAPSSFFPGTPNSSGAAACGTTWAFPDTGTLRNLTVAAAVTWPAYALRVGVNPDCAISGAPNTGSIVVPPLAAVGTVADTYGLIWPVSLGTYFSLNESKNSGGGATTAATGPSLEYVSASGKVVTPLLAGPATALSASTNSFCGMAGGVCGATELAQALPMPFAGTISSFWVGTSTAPTNSYNVQVNHNGSASALTVNPLSTDTSPTEYNDAVHSFTVAAGDYIDVEALPGAGTVQTVQSYAVNLTPTSGTTFLVGGIVGGTVAGTTEFNMPFGNYQSATEVNGLLAVPRAFTASNLYVCIAGTQGAGITTTFTLIDGGSSGTTYTSTALTGSIAAATVAGCYGIDLTHTVSILKGDRIGIQIVTTGGTSATIGGWAMQGQ
jgi:hypothetical protein